MNLTCQSTCISILQSDHDNYADEMMIVKWLNSWSSQAACQPETVCASLGRIAFTTSLLAPMGALYVILGQDDCGNDNIGDEL